MNDAPHTGNITPPSESQPHNDALFPFEYTHLERLRLAAEVILELADAIPAPLEAELTIFKERVEHAQLKQRPAAAGDTGSGPLRDRSPGA